MATLTTTIIALNGGNTAVPGTGEDTSITVTGAWLAGDQYTITFTDNTTGAQTQIGAGNITGVTPTYVLVFNNKTYLLGGNTVYISAVGDPTTWNNPNGIGNGYLTLGDYFGSSAMLVAAAPYQGKIVFFSRYSTQIWTVDADLGQWQLLQILQNIGTVAGASVQPLGDLDVFFLSDTGIRSLRPRDLTLNAFVPDIGSPIDSLIQSALLANNYTTACGIVEPSANRYWCYLNGVIYVLSYFPSAKITAWGMYWPTYATYPTASVGTYPVTGSPVVTYAATVGRSYYWIKGMHEVSITDGAVTYSQSCSFVSQGATLTVKGVAGTTITANDVEEQTPFTPTKFITYNGQVFCRDATHAFVFGGADNNTYDGTIATAATSWLDAKEPSVLKQSRGFESAFSGSWTFFEGMNQLNEQINKVWQGTKPTFQLGQIDFSDQGYHIKMQANTWDNQAATLSSLVFRYKKGNEK